MRTSSSTDYATNKDVVRQMRREIFVKQKKIGIPIRICNRKREIPFFQLVLQEKTHGKCGLKKEDPTIAANIQLLRNTD